jgi:hypothetical protein
MSAMIRRRDLLGLAGAAALTSLLRPLSAEQQAALGGELHARVRTGVRSQSLTASQLALVGAIADTVIPRTQTPGATDVGVPAFVDLVLAEWHTPGERADFLAGLEALEARSQRQTGEPFGILDAAARERFLTGLDGREGAPRSAEAAFARLKRLAVYGYITSREVQSNVLRTPMIPGQYEGCAKEH